MFLLQRVLRFCFHNQVRSDADREQIVEILRGGDHSYQSSPHPGPCSDATSWFGFRGLMAASVGNELYDKSADGTARFISHLLFLSVNFDHNARSTATRPVASSSRLERTVAVTATGKTKKHKDVHPLRQII